MGIRDTAAILKVSANKVLKTLASNDYALQSKRSHYANLEIDELWTYIGKKKNKMWLIYVYHRASGEIIAYVWGKRDARTARALRERLLTRGITVVTGVIPIVTYTYKSRVKNTYYGIAFDCGGDYDFAAFSGVAGDLNAIRNNNSINLLIGLLLFIIINKRIQKSLGEAAPPPPPKQTTSITITAPLAM